MSTHPMPAQRAYIILSVGLVLLLVAAFAIFRNSALPFVPTHGSAAKAASAPPPPPSADVRAQLATSKGFNALVSYTDTGFEPAHITIKAGDTVRFTNNSHGSVWVAAVSPAYPGTSVCGSSRFDTCKELKPGEFWEFTFDSKGTWQYRNNSNTSKTGIVLVK